jgi:hypothetical protein
MTSQQDVNERMETDPCALLVTGSRSPSRVPEAIELAEKS